MKIALKAKVSMKRILNLAQSHKFIIISAIILGALFYIAYLFIPFGKSPFSGLSNQELYKKIDIDYEMLKRSILKMDSVLRCLRRNKDVFDCEDLKYLSIDNRKRMISLWGDFISHISYYDRLISEYRFFYRIYYPKNKFLHSKAFLIGYTAFVSRFLYGSELIRFVNGNPLWEKIFDEEVRDYNIPHKTYAALKWNVIHVHDVLRLTAGYGHLQFLKPSLTIDGFAESEGEIFEYIDKSFKRSTKILKQESAVWFPQNGLDILKQKTFDVWFPLQKGAANIIGDIRFTQRAKNFITPAHIKTLKSRLEPGDIMVQRRNWNLSNVSIPGFWPHVALYIGTKEDFINFFVIDNQVKELVGKAGITAYLKQRYPLLWSDYKGYKTVIEALASGIILNTMEKSACADYLGIIRPRLSKKDRFLALCEAFSHYKKPYDFNFDFITDSALVCSELVYKAYLPAQNKEGLDLPLISYAGRTLLSPNSIVETCDKQYNTLSQQLDFVCFIDYDLRTGCVKDSTLEEFRRSWRRPKWDILLE